MKVKDILKTTNRTVVTAPPQMCVIELSARLAEHNIGAIIISETGKDIVGIVSERDIVRGLHRNGENLLAEPAVAIMTSTVTTCGPEQDTEAIAQLMTSQRIRHIPVVDETGLIGLISIGDIVNQRIAELTNERDQLTTYISS